jgi:hypothetical protein
MFETCISGATLPRFRHRVYVVDQNGVIQVKFINFSVQTLNIFQFETDESEGDGKEYL